MASTDMVFRWRKSSRSGANGSCVELGHPAPTWRKSSRSGEAGACVELGRSAPTWRKSSHSGEAGECVELAYLGAVRDSKNSDGPVLRTDLGDLLAAVKAGRFDR